MNIVETLKAIKALIAKPSNWTQGDLARDLNNASVFTGSAVAAKWCVVGAKTRICGLDRCGGDVEWRVSALMKKVAKNHYGMEPISLNDTRRHADVMEFLNQCIAEAEKQP